MALVTFRPAGSQLDGDAIADLALNPGDRLTASFTLDTSGLDSDLQSLTLQIDQDFEEVGFSLVRTDFDTTTFPGLELVGISAEDNFDSAIFERQGEPGAAPDTTDIIVEGEITVLDGLNNDGQPDIGITVLDAVDANGQNVTELFEPINQSIDLQPLPIASISASSIAFVEGGETLTYTFRFTEPVPPGGLVLDILITDPDMQVDSEPNFAEAGNIVDGETVIENGQAIAKLTIAEGATEATLEFSAFEDNVAEGNEEFSLTLLPGDGYSLDPNNNSVTSVIVDAETVIDGTNEDDVLNGTANVDAILGKVGNDLISGNDASDALFGGDGSDRLFGDGGEDLLFGEAGADRLFGGNKSDTLEGNLGRDTLIGGNHSDLLLGGEDEDRLIGVELNSNEPGINEQDILTGGLGADTFVLGNEAGIFYSDRNSFASGDADFARITDFNPQEDRILLFGFAEQYTLDFLPNNNGSIDVKLIYDSGLDSGSELIALIENVDSNLSIDDTAFAFI